MLAAEQPTAQELGADAWIAIPKDASGIVVRQYLADRSVEVAAELAIEPLDPPPPPAAPDDALLGEQLTGMAWTIAKLTTLHRSIRPELLDMPNRLITAQADELGSADTTPDNLYMMGTFRLDDDEALLIEIEPPDSRYWSVSLENIWHECIEPRRRQSHLTNATVVAGADGRVQMVAAATDPGLGNWLDTGGRRRGFVTIRWLDKPEPPVVSCRVVKLDRLPR